MADTMSVAVSTGSSPWARPALRAVALPIEHGGWGLLAEPILLGLMVAPSAGGVAIATAALFGFLWRHPARIAIADVRRGVRYPRTSAAIVVASAYAALALGA